MAGVISIQRSILKRFLPGINHRLVSTSKRNNETATIEECKTDVKSKTKEVVHKDWISYGFDYETKTGDRTAMHSIMFASVTLCLVVGGFYMAYLPDYALADWSQPRLS
ncbi:hypothetical protein NQ314_014491 [Rhamnusium bicolor]|uniref:NADH dehydrogenase [ubiquinone] 1 beta subcomplex subunit 11, mitochondrial n=1 Tax=Rhamnusium bicolor TaxID=1586634 RepID=A0AAV8X328_9CUCU|nr:hypothetical protein NQ314_014491 [Rhamnusium bicolor]